MTELTVLDPIGLPPKVTGRGLAPPLAALTGKTVFLVDVGFENSDTFMVAAPGLVRGARARRADQGRPLAQPARARSRPVQPHSGRG